ncbi:signal transduction histidine kinase/ligand-binding sensor domain-containing protein [Sphingomonas zeicaulis]|uniref:sensor histidine kinase n=1 Tax=Sphingomonas zeicaulis TaxID=1632740 RepID=UPI003D1D7873
MGKGQRGLLTGMMRLIGIPLALALLMRSPAVEADPGRRLAHYVHYRWTGGDEVPAPVLGMAQGRDGFLWLATAEGLFRFDGISFEAIRAGTAAGSEDPPSTVMVARNGDVWVALRRSHRFLVYRGGRLRAPAPAAPEWIIELAEARDGAVWALTASHSAEVLRVADGRWQRFGPAQGVPHDDALSLLVAPDGAIWVSLCNSIIRMAPGAPRFSLVRETPRANGRLSLDPEGRVWISERGGSYALTGTGGRGAPDRPGRPYATDDAQIRGAPMFDRSGNLWLATRYAGLQRVAAGATPGTAPELFRTSDGLSSDVTNRLLEDREGNIWIGTEKGLDRLRASTLRFEPRLTAPAAFGDKLMVARDGSVYVGQARALYRIRPGGDPEAILTGIREPQSLCEAPDGAIWVGFGTDILILDGGRVRRTIPRPEVRSIIYDCAFDAAGDFWISAAAGGLHRYRQGHWERMYGATHVDGFTPMTLVRDSAGRLVVQWSFGELAWLDGTTPRLRPIDFGNAERDAVTLHAGRSGDIYVAGAFGISRFHNGRIERRAARPASDNSRINGMVQTPDGDTWLAYPRALVRMRSADFARALAEPAFNPPVLALGAAEGLVSRPHSKSQLALVQGGDGRLWLATETGTMWMDPHHIVRNALPPPVAIKSIVADGRMFRDPASVLLAAGTSSIEIDFAALSFADPRQVGVRYRLDGFDRGWLDPGARRQAFYTNLPPGQYRFRVIAANEAGIWNREGAAVAFEIPPTFLQSRWFIAACALALLLLGWLLYRLRLAQVAGRIRSRLEERLGERERIARELHDTLLQSVQGLVLRFQSVANRMPAEGEARAHLESALRRADDVITEGRNRVQDLRVSDGSSDLPGLLKERAEAAGFDGTVHVRIVVEGRPRPVHPLVSVELGRIADEALFNIVRHARASAVEITIRFSRRELGLEVCDDGIGMPAHICDAGHKPGHFGLVGMQERAQRIGGTFSIESKPGMGAAVTITLPARLAFADHRPRRRLLPRLFFRHRDADHG